MKDLYSTDLEKDTKEYKPFQIIAQNAENELLLDYNNNIPSQIAENENQDQCKTGQIYPSQTVSCQTDFSEDFTETCTDHSIRFLRKNGKRNFLIHKFCWRHDRYEYPVAPARPSSPTSSVSNDGLPVHLEEPHLIVEQGPCEICKEEEERRLNLKSRRETTAFRKTVATPSLATVRHCPINLLQEKIPNCSSLWNENQTFYLGVEKEGKTSEGRRRRRPYSVPPLDRLTTCKQCQKEIGHSPYGSRTSSICQKHSFRIRSLSLNTKEKSLSKTKADRKDWILVQKVIKKVPANPSEENPHSYYITSGPQEMLFCLHSLRSIYHIENICCRNFLSMSRQESLDQGETIELLFSSQGPVMHDDKDLKGRSIFYFCCHVETIKPNKKSSGPNDVAISTSFENQIDLSNFKSKGKRQEADVEKRKKQRGVGTKRMRKDTMRKNSKTENQGSEKPKKSVTFSEDTKPNVDTEKCDNGADPLLLRRSSLPPPPKLKLSPEEDEVIVQRKRRESVNITFHEPTQVKPKPKNNLNEIKEEPRVATYQKKEWKTLNISISFKTDKFSNEFYEYKTLQDLYTWLREELLKKELLTPGSELLLSNDNLKFPLKANTAMNILSNLPTTEFHCNEILKKGVGSGGPRETTSKYDTRFALPLDTRQLEGLTPTEYLSRYCFVSDTWRAFYLSVFTSHDKYKNKKLNYKETTTAMERLFVELAQPLLKRVIDLMGLKATESASDSAVTYEHQNSDWKTNFCIDSSTFVSMCCLANRIICRENEIDGFPVDTIKQSGTQLEDADFYNIEGKLNGFTLDPRTKRLLLYVRNNKSHSRT